MKFFNQKEDVIDLQVTQYGKYLLSKGKFKPVFYAFFDDDILYEKQGSTTNEEDQNKVEPRIQSDTPRLHTQYVFSGRESRINEHTEHFLKNVENKLSARSEFTIEDKERWAVQPNVDNNHTTMLPMGSAASSVQNIPAWSLVFLKGVMTASAPVTSGSALSVVRIPQIDSEPRYEFSVGTLDEFNDDLDQDFGADDDYPGAPGVEQDEYLDDTFVKVKEDFIVLEIEEKNSIFENLNFDIQVFEVRDVPDDMIPESSREELIPLGFVTEAEKDTGQELNTDFGFVEHYFDIFVDQEIDDKLLCKLAKGNKKKGLYSDRIIECEDENIQSSDIYRRALVNEDFEEPCD